MNEFEELNADPKHCANCGKAIGSAYTECSVSCRLAVKIPLGERSLPASWALCGFMGSGFIFFNQGLFLSLSLVKRLQGEPEASKVFGLASIVAGCLWLIGAFTAWCFCEPKHWIEYGAFGAIAIIAVTAVFWPIERAAFEFLLFIFNLLVSIDLYKGLVAVRRKLKNREKSESNRIPIDPEE